MDGIEIQSPIGDEFAQVYHRHKAEIHQIVNQNPFLVWETVDLIVEVLPALRSVRPDDGKLYVDKRTFSKADDLFARCEALASPGLANDLRKARAQVDSRITEWDSERILVDLEQIEVAMLGHLLLRSPSRTVFRVEPLQLTRTETIGRSALFGMAISGQRCLKGIWGV